MYYAVTSLWRERNAFDTQNKAWACSLTACRVQFRPRMHIEGRQHNSVNRIWILPTVPNAGQVQELAISAFSRCICVSKWAKKSKRPAIYETVAWGAVCGVDFDQPFWPAIFKKLSIVTAYFTRNPLSNDIQMPIKNPCLGAVGLDAMQRYVPLLESELVGCTLCWQLYHGSETVSPAATVLWIRTLRVLSKLDRKILAAVPWYELES
jgi:hypothetical protein